MAVGPQALGRVVHAGAQAEDGVEQHDLRHAAQQHQPAPTTARRRPVRQRRTPGASRASASAAAGVVAGDRHEHADGVGGLAGLPDGRGEGRRADQAGGELGDVGGEVHGGSVSRGFATCGSAVRGPLRTSPAQWAREQPRAGRLRARHARRGRPSRRAGAGRRGARRLVPAPRARRVRRRPGADGRRRRPEGHRRGRDGRRRPVAAVRPATTWRSTSDGSNT